MENIYFGGIEGGATHSKLVICDENGTAISSILGPGTNHWTLGIAGCAKRIAEMVHRGKAAANIPQTHKLQSLGLSLSGCEEESTNKALEIELLRNHPDISEHYVVCSDTVGSVFTASKDGGLVLISGTGSNALLRNPNGTTYSCGGWGHMLGDEGSAWWISHTAVKIVFDHMDNFKLSQFDISTVWNLIQVHFSAKTRMDLLDHSYGKFDKALFAGLCTKISEAANNGDPLCQNLFNEAGKLLAMSIIALLPKVDEELTKTGYLNIVCVGSVWKSWNLLKTGFQSVLANGNLKFGLKMLRLTQAMAMGAVYIAADSVNFDLKRDYTQNYEVFHYYSHNKSELIIGGGGGGDNENDNHILSIESNTNSIHF